MDLVLICQKMCLLQLLAESRDLGQGERKAPGKEEEGIPLLSYISVLLEFIFQSVFITLQFW